MKNLILIIFISICTYLIADFGYSLKRASYNKSFFSQGCIKNSISLGYEYHSNMKCRYKRIIQNIIEYDNEFKINNFGFTSSFDYQYLKNDKRRVAVLGYSMTEGNYIPVNWPSRITEISNGKLEVYNFARAGYFNLNLYSLYFNQLIKYDYDILMLPKIGANESQFMVFEERADGVYDGLFKNIPLNVKQYEHEYSNKLSLLYNFFDAKNDLSIMHRFVILYENIILGKKIFSKLFGDNSINDVGDDYKIIAGLINYPERFNKIYGKRNISIYLSIISDALRRNQKIVFYQDPQKGIAPSDSKKDKTYELYRWLNEIKPGSFFYYDGNDAFITEGVSDTKKYFFKNDGHWNQNGSDMFAKHLNNYLNGIY